ncbi:IS66 family transposase zinc-finger binding domain-containing protein [Methylomarinum sp. Ch1-1]|uniref:IS66 family transposase zinc-finger binding domain-containing protein n=1 Tax=Methylomarinum roseum TaxID=3067653 RepID=A0AAU7NU73_9GAMM|nr:IS66 family transposase zinc-finger binding domain-containing protein [Methylomarinum sp. Ch1-1]MDP4519414.1 IS66 family transposase zinc-finger binding domain-containing protein [Methylomarinum sp. Ch1-1]
MGGRESGCHRALLPVGALACGGTIEMAGLPDERHQIFDLPEVKPTVTEHQRYSDVCRHCGSRHKSAYPDTVPSGQMGPGLISWISLLNGGYRLSLRQVQRLLQEHWGLGTGDWPLV